MFSLFARLRRPRPAPRRGRRRALAVATALALVAAGPAGAARQEPEPPSTEDPPVTPPLWERVPDPRLSPGLIKLPVDSRELRAAIAAWEQTLTDIADTEETIVSAEARLGELAAEREQLRAELSAAQTERAVALADLDVIQRALDHVAVERYTAGGPGTEAIELLLSRTPGDDVYAREIADQFSDVQIEKREERRRWAEDLDVMVATYTAALVATGTAIVDTQALLDESHARLTALRDDLPRREQAVRDRRMTALVDGTDITLVVLDAYVKAAARMRQQRASCGIEWWMIAALGRIESRHGTIFGSQVQPDGRTSVRIIGIPLDGDNNTARIADTDGGALDGDTTYDRAVGPMQFIPSTWAEFARDGNGDGARDPHNIYDAALAAAAYLCARGGDLSDPDSLRAAYFAYNRSSSYVASAIANGARYRTLALPGG